MYRVFGNLSFAFFIPFGYLPAATLPEMMRRTAETTITMSRIYNIVWEIFHLRIKTMKRNARITARLSSANAITDHALNLNESSCGSPVI
jgi:hypothetical protein